MHAARQGKPGDYDIFQLEAVGDGPYFIAYPLYEQGGGVEEQYLGHPFEALIFCHMPATSTSAP